LRFQAIWNTNAFFAYLITVKLFNLQWEVRKLIAVVIATLGVAVVVYGGVASRGGPTSGKVEISSVPSAPVVGSLLTLVASIGYGLYQVLYKMYAALPSDPEAKQHTLYQSISDDGELPAGDEKYAVYPPPFGLYADLLTSLIGVATLLILWIFLPIIHFAGIEIFRLPSDSHVLLSIVGISLTGVVFNAGLMVRSQKPIH
jgi:drug/metabolite transporter (DMT)-like permease